MTIDIPGLYSLEQIAGLLRNLSLYELLAEHFYSRHSYPPGTRIIWPDFLATGVKKLLDRGFAT
jgi:hypothetical protein